MSSFAPERSSRESGGGPLRIVQMVESLRVGGLETMAVQLAAAHRRAGHFSAIYTMFENGPLEAEAKAAGVAVWAMQKRPGFSPRAVARVARQLRRDGAEVVHTHNSGVHHYGAVSGKLAGAAVVSTRHGLALHSSKRQEIWYRSVLPLTDAVIFVCDYGRRYYEQRGAAPPGKSSVVINGIPVARFEACPASPGAALPRIRFGTIGRLVRAKAHADLLDAFAIVARENAGVELDIWGYGELQQDLEARIAALGLAGRARYRGPAARPEEALQALDVFVLSSISEGLPLVVLEAMAAGLPVVSTRVGGVPEVLAPGASWLADAANPPSLAAAMRAAAESDLARAGRTARAAAQAFTVESMQAGYEAAYRAVLRRRAGA